MNDRIRAIDCPSCGAPLEIPPKHKRLFLCNFCGTTLLDIKIKSLLSLSSYLKDIVVSTDCDHMIDIAKSYGVKTHRRDAYFQVLRRLTQSFLVI